MADPVFKAGGWCDVVPVPSGWAFVYVHDLDVICEINGIEVWRHTVTGTFGMPRYLRAAADDAGTVKAACSVSMSESQDNAFIISQAGQLDRGICRQNHPVMLTFESGDFVLYKCDTFDTYVRWPQAGVPSAPIPIGRDSTLGFLDVVNGVITWANNETGGYTYEVHADVIFLLPNTRAGVVVGQAKGQPITAEGIIAFHRTGVSTIFPIKGFDPHLARISAGPDTGKYVFCARLENGGNNAAYRLVDVWPAYDGVLSPDTIPPVENPVEENTVKGVRMTRPWQGWAHAIRRALIGIRGQISGLQQAVTLMVSFGRVIVPGQPTVEAEEPNAALTLQSLDESVVITTDPTAKSVDLAAAPKDAQYLLAETDARLPDGRLVVDTPTVTWDFTTPGEAKANATGGGAYVPVSTGEEPLVILSNGAGSVLLTPYTPS